jgi:hypothetical protein
MNGSDQNLLDRIEEALKLANQLSFIDQVVNERDKAVLKKWMVRWRETKRRLMRDRIDD